MSKLSRRAWASMGRGGRATRMFARDQRGVVAVEFAFVALPLAFLIFSILELGLVFLVGMSLESATAKAARTVRTGAVQMAGGGSKEAFRDAICAELGWLEHQCPTSLSVDVRTYDNFAYEGAPNPIKTVAGKQVFDDDATTYATGEAGDIVLVRSFYRWPLITPFLRGGLERLEGGVTLLTSSFTFRNEPYK